MSAAKEEEPAAPSSFHLTPCHSEPAPQLFVLVLSFRTGAVFLPSCCHSESARSGGEEPAVPVVIPTPATEQSQSGDRSNLCSLSFRRASAARQEEPAFALTLHLRAPTPPQKPLGARALSGPGSEVSFRNGSGRTSRSAGDDTGSSGKSAGSESGGRVEAGATRGCQTWSMCQKSAMNDTSTDLTTTSSRPEAGTLFLETIESKSFIRNILPVSTYPARFCTECPGSKTRNPNEGI